MVRVVIPAGILLCSAVMPPPAKAGFFTGNEMVAKCEVSRDSPVYYASDAFCSAYVMGVFDDNETLNAVLGKRLYCTSPDMTGKQVRDVAVAYMERHPESRHESASLLVLKSFTEAFPCPSK